jgi:transcriptional regulator with XRE-family HTH domain
MDIVRDARLAEGLTQAQLARRLGITQPSVARLEAAGDEVSVATLQRALNAMGRTLVLRTRKQPSSVDEPQVRELLRLTPGERLELHDRSYPELRAWANEAQAAVARVA